MCRYSLSKPWKMRNFQSDANLKRVCLAVTIRLSDALPMSVLKSFAKELEGLVEEDLCEKTRKKIEFWLDSGLGSCVLEDLEVASCVESVLLKGDGDKYELKAWCIMPNHIHVLVEVDVDEDVDSIVSSWRSLTEAIILSKSSDFEGMNKEKVSLGQYWSRTVPHNDDYEHLVKYLHYNPVAAGLCREVDGWRWSSSWKGHEEGCETHKQDFSDKTKHSA